MSIQLHATRVYASTAHLLFGVARAVLVVALVTWAGTAAAQPTPFPLAVDVQSVEVSGDFLLDGAPTPTGPADIALVSLVDRSEGVIPVGTTDFQVYGPVRLIPGTYDARYDFFFTGGTLPINVGTLFGTPLALTSTGVADLDIPTVQVTFTLLLNGAAFPAGEMGDFLLRDAAGTEFPLGSSAASPIVARLIPGTYDVIYSYGSGATIPRNSRAVVLAGASFRASGSRVIDLTSLAHTLDPTVDGSPFPISTAERGEFFLVDPIEGDSVSFGPTNAPFVFVPVLAGTYDVVYSHIAGGSIAPVNSSATVLSGVPVQPPAPPGPSVTAFDVVTHEVSHAITIDGVPPPASTAERGYIFFVGEGDDEIDFGLTDAPSPVDRVIEGSYEVHYRHRQGGGIVPRNENARIATGVVIDQDQVVAVDIPTVELSLDLQVEGAPFPASTAERGRVFLTGEEPDDVIDLGTTDAGLATWRYVAGTYHVDYDWINGLSIVPRNEGLRIVGDTTYLADQTIAANVATHLVEPVFTLDGSPFPADPARSGAIVLRDDDGGEVPLGSTDVTVPSSVVVANGDYDIDYLWIAGVDVPRNPRTQVGTTFVPEPGGLIGLSAGVLGLLALRRRRRWSLARSLRGTPWSTCSSRQPLGPWRGRGTRRRP